jgi:hypothetical protein
MYIRHGWSLVPIPAGTKGPRTAGWNQRHNAMQSQAQLPPGYGIGLAHAYSGTMALDIDSWDAATQMLGFAGIDLNALYDAPDAVVVDSGKQGHGKLLYAMPFGLALPSKKISAGDQTVYELRCATANGLTVQDVLPPSIHPDTNQPYRWAGRGHWTRLPVIPMPLLTLWQSMLSQDAQVIAPATAVHADWSEIKSILEHISPDCSRDEWIIVGMALHYTGTSTGELDAALHLWNDWSKPSSKYPGEAQMLVQWRSFRSDKGSTVKLGSLYKLAHDAGWEKPVPDVSAMFSNTEMQTPAQVTKWMRPEPPTLNFDTMPKVMADVALNVADSVGCDPLIPLWSGLAAVSAALDARSRLVLREGFEVPPVLWVMTIGNPAGKKSPGSKPMLQLFKRLEQEDRPRYQKAVQVFEALDARHQSEKKAFLDAAKDVHGMLAGELPQGYGDAPKPPTPLRVVVDDISSQMLVRIAADNPRGIICHLDEMASWTKKLTDPRSTDAKSTWTTGFESTYYKMDRVGAGEIEAENYALTIYGNIQPRVFTASVDRLSDDGLLQRFIPVVLREGGRRLGTPTAGRRKSLDDYEMVLRAVFGMPAMTYRLAPDAEALFVEFQKWYLRRMDDEELLKVNDIYLQALGKIEGLVGRLIFILHVVQNPYSVSVSAETVQQGITIAKEYIIPTLRYTYNGELAGADSFDEWVKDHIVQYSDQSSITLSDIRRNARRQIEKMPKQVQVDAILSAMQPLEAAKWVARVDDGSKESQGRAQWAINPGLAQQFADHRRSVIEAKQRIMDHVYRDAVKKKPIVYGYDKVA